MSTLESLLALPGAERADLALALWESLGAEDREQVLTLRADEAAELHRRWQEYLDSPERAISGDELLRGLRGGT